MSKSLLDAATGYFELDLFDECSQALDQLEESDAQQVEAMELNVLVAIARQEWLAAIEKADAAMKAYPKALFGPIQKAYALHELGRTPEALETLNAANGLKESDHESVYHYNRACYAVTTGDLAHGREALQTALRLNPGLKIEALADPDLKPIRDSIEDQA